MSASAILNVWLSLSVPVNSVSNLLLESAGETSRLAAKGILEKRHVLTCRTEHLMHAYIVSFSSVEIYLRISHMLTVWHVVYEKLRNKVDFLLCSISSIWSETRNLLDKFDRSELIFHVSQIKLINYQKSATPALIWFFSQHSQCPQATGVW